MSTDTQIINEMETSQETNGVVSTDKTDEINSKNDLKFRENLYRLIISQLFYDGHQHVAVGLSSAIQVIIILVILKK